jgi:hypothetical protein
LIRPAEDYGRFWQLHAAQEEPPSRSAPELPPPAEPILTPEQLPLVWQQASWLRVIDVFSLETDPQRRRREDEIWIKSPFTGEQKASMHVSLSQNIFKDFSSGKGGGIIQFCREMLRLRGQEISMLETARWMVAQGISTPVLPGSASAFAPAEQATAAKARAAYSPSLNPAIPVDLRPYLRADHPEWRRRGVSPGTCRYLGCGFLPPRPGATKTSPLNARLVFQIRSVRENGQGPEPVIVSHAGRALQPEQESRDGKYWSYPFRKGWELYNQDLVLLDQEARRQAGQFGLIVTEGFFDVAKLVEADCRNAVALMGSTISEEQAERLGWLRARVGFPRLVLFLDRDAAGQKQVRERLRRYDLVVTVFDWNQTVSWNGREPERIPDSIQDPADLGVEQLRALRRQAIL